MTGVKMETEILSDKQYIAGMLNTEAPGGKGTMIEYVVLTTLGDCIKESFNYQFDLTSKKLGEINVKSSSRLNSKNGYEWAFGKHPNSYIPDYFICVGMNNLYTEILHVWIIPGNSRLIGSHGIHVIDNPNGLKKVSKYEVNSTPYNEVLHSIDFTSFPEFKNIDNDELKRGMGIARSIRDGKTLDEINNEYGEEYYHKYLKWVFDNKLKTYFHINTGLVGIFSSSVFIEMTKFTYPVFDIMGKYTGYVNIRDFVPNRKETTNYIDGTKLVWNAIKELTENGECIDINNIRCKTDIEKPEKYLIWMVYYGDIAESHPGYVCKYKEIPEMCTMERVRIVRDAFIKLSRINTKIFLNQVLEVSGFDNIEKEIYFLKRRGELLQAKADEFRWV